jgi:hypothetical protein
MNILRKPPYPLTISYTVPDADTLYDLVIKDRDRDVVLFEDSVDSTLINPTVTYILSSMFSTYDDSYSLTITDADTLEIVVEDNLDISRPYVDPSTLGITATEIAEYRKHEFLARSIIDSIVAGGFYYTPIYIETTGQGTDYMPLWDRVYKILEVYENAELVWDSALTPSAIGDWNYVLTKDKTAITKDPVAEVDALNRQESAPVGMNLAASDSFEIFDTQDSGNTMALKPGVVFPAGWDYIFQLESGHKVVPYDIQEATKLLIDDIKCGKLEYFKKYITSYSTDQYRIQIDKQAFSGTGNILVDKILDKYIVDVRKPGVL